MTVPLVRCSALPMFEGRPLIVTAQLEASQVEPPRLERPAGRIAKRGLAQDQELGG